VVRRGEAEATHRPQLAQRALQQRVVHRKRQPRLVAAAARADERARAQRVVEVGGVHLRALVSRAHTQPRHRLDRAAPRTHERAVARAVLQPGGVEAVVERADTGGAGA